MLILSDFSASATTWQSDGSQASVQKLHDNSAQDGDTITLPAGTFGWTQPVRITKSITLQGQSNVTGAGTANWSDDRATTVLDDTPRSGSNALIIDVNVAANKSARITGITFAAGATTQFNEAAILDLLVRMLPQVVAAAADPMRSIDKLTVISTDGAGSLTKTVASNVAQGLQLGSDLTGIDLAGLLARLAAPATTNGDSGPKAVTSSES